MLHSNTLRRSALAVVAATLSIGMMACNKTTPPATNSVTAVSATAAKTTLAIGETTQATATVTVTGSAAKTVTWTSDNAAVASVNASTGLITAKTAGTANISACSTVSGFTTKCGSVKVTVSAATSTGPTAAFNVQFTAAGAPVAANFTADRGAAFNGTSGWVTEATANSATPTALPMASATRYRDPSDTANIVQGLATEKYGLVLLHCTTCSSSTEAGPAAWEYKVNPGKYDVEVSVGDADKRNTDSNYVINVEGVKVLGPVAPTAGQIVSATKTSIQVNDGFLTVDSIGGTNTKINYIKVTPSAVQ
ncbi:hypothetical protein HNQ07_001475 [Deinococcus metalli]|uniref:BIG2 domain-containing protein n=1 Tax=Deinococcus metalli TaxID=1141878 RepID=A0A7W8KE13_9DEIO|nr:Ig-like domain-containing protein [Deinococcus metalli]MBB5376018.1 hypothetical protein [Deinococcus metalli]GHF41434.1 hypothetical protein GCM10017781_17650 [Deinococcus metalli]